MPKGQKFEREICHRLSCWWTGSTKKSVFWRTANSGGRATVRGKKETTGHHGDICSTCPESSALTNLLILELKKGYSTRSPFDLIDKPNRRPVRGKKDPLQLYEKWFAKADACREAAKVPFWLMIVGRNQRELITLFPQQLKSELQSVGAFHGVGLLSPFMHLRYPDGNDQRVVIAIRLTDFLAVVEPIHIVKLAKRFGG